jgi:hypothetical protein
VQVTHTGNRIFDEHTGNANQASARLSHQVTKERRFLNQFLLRELRAARLLDEREHRR